MQDICLDCGEEMVEKYLLTSVYYECPVCDSDLGPTSNMPEDGFDEYSYDSDQEDMDRLLSDFDKMVNAMGDKT